MTKFDANDPRLTAFALGELETGEAEQIERELRNDEALRREVDDIRAMAEALQSELRAETAPRLTAAQREAIEREPKHVLNSPLVFRTSARWIAAGAALAACAALALTAFLMLNPRVADQSPVAIGGEAGQAGKKEAQIEKFALSREESNARRQALPTPESVPASAAKSKLEARSRSLSKDVASDASTLAPPPKPSSVAPAGGMGARGARELSPPPTEITTLDGLRNTPKDSGGRPATGSPAPGGDLGISGTGGAGALNEVDADRAKRDRAEFDEVRADAAGEGIALIEDNPFTPAISEPLSTFSIDVDTASYANVRRFINQGALPPRDAVRIEEMVNYFDYSYEPPSAADGDAPFSANVEVNIAPWNPVNRLVRIGLKGKEVKLDMRPATSLVFLIDVSGSMRDQMKLPLVKDSLKLLIGQLNADDRLAIVTYAGQAGLVLDSTYVTPENRERILQTIDSLSAGGSTNGAGGIQAAYETAARHFIKGGVNRVILCTDGDFNVGVSNESELVQLIEAKRTTGVFLSVLGFGSGNLQEAKMQQLAKHGNGNFAYIDSIDEGHKVLVEQMGGTLIAIAKDVKIQVDFNPAKVGAYRLIGYENRMLAAQDFANDKKDAGEIGSGHTVTALYEISPPDPEMRVADARTAPRSDFMQPLELVESELLMNLKIRYKQPEGDQSAELVFPIGDQGASWNRVSPDFKFAAAVAAFGMVLRNSPHKGDATFDSVLAIAREGLAPSASSKMKQSNATDEDSTLSRRAEFIELVEKAKAIVQRAQ